VQIAGHKPVAWGDFHLSEGVVVEVAPDTAHYLTGHYNVCMAPCKCNYLYSHVRAYGEPPGHRMVQGRKG
jgi:hypothetical protein